jgi:NADH-quinone oxidoreductase subunit C
MTDPTAAEEAAEAPVGPADAELAMLEATYGVAATRSRDQLVLHPSREQYPAVVAALFEAGYRQCLDVCGVDYLIADTPRPLPDGVQPGRYEVVAQFLNHGERTRIRTRVQIPADDPTCPSLFAWHAGAENPEREAFDLVGITFTEHPDMTRILMPETWQGHPLRKDYATGRIPVQFKAADPVDPDRNDTGAADRASAPR